MEDTELTAQQEPQTEVADTTDWKAEAERYKSEHEKMTSQYKHLQRELNKARQSSVTRDDLTAFEDRMAAALESMRERDDEEPERPKRLTPTEIIRQARETKKEPQEDPAFKRQVLRVEQKAKELGMPVGSDEFEKLATGADGDYLPPDEVLEKLNDVAVSKLAATKAKEMIEAEKVEAAQKLKESGATKPGGSPSASSLADDELRRRFIANPDDPIIAREWLSKRDSYYARKNK